MKIKETIHFKASNGIKLYLRLDYEYGKVSILEKTNSGNYKQKDFRFSNRGRDFLGGWVLIFRALEEATIFADKMLAAEEEAREQAESDKITSMMVALAELNEKNTAKED